MTQSGRDVDEFFRLRDEEAERTHTQALSGVLAVDTPLPGRTFSVVEELESAHLARTAVILLTGDDANPYLVLGWR
jgi:hypothetical protein